MFLNPTESPCHPKIRKETSSSKDHEHVGCEVLCASSALTGLMKILYKSPHGLYRPMISSFSVIKSDNLKQVSLLKHVFLLHFSKTSKL